GCGKKQAVNSGPPGEVSATDWPQWRGPNRTDVSRETGLLKTWPKEGPKLLWTFDDDGVGFSAPAIAGGRLYSMGGRSGSEYVYAVDIQSGGEIWSAKVGPLFTNGWGDGPRGTPTIDGDALYAIGGQGNLVCVEIASGKVRWQTSLTSDLG